MENLCFLLVFKDALFRQILSNLLIEINNSFEVFESNAEDIDDLLEAVLQHKPDTVLLEENSPLSAAASLAQLLVAMPSRPIVVVSQKVNLMHVWYWRTVQVETVYDLIGSIKDV